MMDLNDQLFARHLDDDEEVQLIVHKHWLLGLKLLWVPTLIFVALWFFLWFAPFKSVFYAVAVFSCACIVWWIRNFFDHYLDAWIITDQGIIDVEWHGWFHRQSTRVLYSDIQGVSYEIQGISSTIFRYGNISIEKISTGSVLTMEHVPRPRAVEAVVLQNMEQYLHSKNLVDAKHVQEILSQIVAKEVQLEGFEDEEEEVEEVVTEEEEA